MDTFFEIEKIVETRLAEEYGASIGRAIWGEYVVARPIIFDIASHIERFEPALTDHGPKHIRNVFDNAWQLLGSDVCAGKDSRVALNTNELYFLALGILFHDLGNIHGRKEHNRHLQASYTAAKRAGVESNKLTEKRHLFAIVEAHCGQTRDGSTDTLRRLEPKGLFMGHQVDCQRVGAILRLADELAEGPQRASRFLQKHFPIDRDSQVYHDYANVTQIAIDRPNERLVLEYEIEICPEDWNSAFDETRLTRLIECCYNRAVKLDLERKYNRHYCSLLRPFKQTEISFHFHLHGEYVPIEIPRIVLDDLVLPSNANTVSLPEKEKTLALTSLIPRLKEMACPSQEPISAT